MGAAEFRGVDGGLSDVGLSCGPDREDPLPCLALVGCASSRELGFYVMREGRGDMLAAMDEPEEKRGVLKK